MSTKTYVIRLGRSPVWDNHGGYLNGIMYFEKQLLSNVENKPKYGGYGKINHI